MSTWRTSAWGSACRLGGHGIVPARSRETLRAFPWRAVDGLRPRGGNRSSNWPANGPRTAGRPYHSRTATVTSIARQLTSITGRHFRTFSCIVSLPGPPPAVPTCGFSLDCIGRNVPAGRMRMADREAREGLRPPRAPITVSHRVVVITTPPAIIAGGDPPLAPLARTPPCVHGRPVAWLPEPRPE